MTGGESIGRITPSGGLIPRAVIRIFHTGYRRRAPDHARGTAPLPPVPRGVLVGYREKRPDLALRLAFHRLHGSLAGAIAVYDPRLGAIVVASHVSAFTEGQVLDVEPI